MSSLFVVVIVFRVNDSCEFTLFGTIGSQSLLVSHGTTLCRVHLSSLFQGGIGSDGQKQNEHNYQQSLIEQLVDKGAHEGSQYGEWFHDENQVPIHQRPIDQGVSLSSVQQGIGNGTPKYGNIGEWNGMLGTKLHDQNVNGNQDTSSTNASTGRNQQSQQTTEKSIHIRLIQGKQGLVRHIKRFHRQESILLLHHLTDKGLFRNASIL
mmetsp:Transcript_20079/g.36444  ORF Transcript_20079/g.36444 Transcript_20079/m.36444 type:complete len:208 (+) Transcript_20079:1112-1735(+)